VRAPRECDACTRQHPPPLLIQRTHSHTRAHRYVALVPYQGVKEYTGDHAPKAKGEGEMLSVKVRLRGWGMCCVVCWRACNRDRYCWRYSTPLPTSLTFQTNNPPTHHPPHSPSRPSFRRPTRAAEQLLLLPLPHSPFAQRATAHCVDAVSITIHQTPFYFMHQTRAKGSGVPF
jgi:hypothetical protein